jgi:hypothetical protein
MGLCLSARGELKGSPQMTCPSAKPPPDKLAYSQVQQEPWIEALKGQTEVPPSLRAQDRE